MKNFQFLKFKALNIIEARERAESMGEASVMMVVLKKDRVLHALVLLEKQN